MKVCPVSLLETAKALLDECVKSYESPVILDGGCYRGVFAQAAVNVFPNAQIVAYEPDTENARLARERLASHGGFRIENAALGETKGRAEFFRGEREATNSLLPRPAIDGQPYYPAAATLTGGRFVDVVTIDDELERLGIGNLTVLKLDLQGGELAALKGAASLLSRSGADIIITEAMFVTKYEGQPLLWQTWGYLDAFGYTSSRWRTSRSAPTTHVPACGQGSGTKPTRSISRGR